ncbi:DUF4145 domain-containing protein [Budvicia aquatica]|nr:DUF4145 domain-containing protein [Budvicia aquatica]
MKAYGVATCPECESPVLIWFECNYGQLQQAQRSSNQAEWRYTGELPKILGTYPSPQNPDDSPYYPQGLRAIFVELQEDILMNRTPARIVSGCRSVLEVALRSLGYEKNNLISRIEQARNDGIITESMKDWSHRVRINGNEAVHELQATQEEASEFVSFLKLFLEVVFVLPERIKQQQPHP